MKELKLFWIPLTTVRSAISEVIINGVKSFYIENDPKFSGDFTVERVKYSSGELCFDSIDQSLKFVLKTGSNFNIEINDRKIINKTFIRSLGKKRGLDYLEWKSEYLASLSL